MPLQKERPHSLAGSVRVGTLVQVPTMPTSFLLGRDGQVRFIHRGFHGDRTEAELRRQIAELLAQPTP